MSRTDAYQLVVQNHSSGARHSFVGSKQDCEAEVEALRKRWKGDKLEVLLEKRK